MAHKTLIGGTVYEVNGGKVLVSGTSYGIASGKTMVNGTGYDITFATIISFTIQLDGEAYPTTYYAEDGMTWGDWVESSYNTDGYLWWSGYIKSNDKTAIVYDRTIGSSVKNDDLIVADRHYTQL